MLRGIGRPTLSRRKHDHRADLHRLAALGILRQAHPGLAEPAHGAQPPTVTSTSTAVDHKLPSLMAAIAWRCCEMATRTRVVGAERHIEYARLRIALREQVNALDIILLGHRAVDGDRYRHDAAVF